MNNSFLPKHFVSILDSDLLCVQCGRINVEMYQPLSCSHLVCSSCWLSKQKRDDRTSRNSTSSTNSIPTGVVVVDSGAIQNSSSSSSFFLPCPRCQCIEVNNNSQSGKLPPQWLQLKLQSLELHCPNKCGLILRLSELNQHISRSCAKVILDYCPHEGCNQQLTRQAMTMHMELCPHRLITCSGCGTKVKSRKFITHQCERGCVELSLARDLIHCRHRCHSTLRQHNYELHSDITKTHQIARKVLLTHFADRGCKGFERWSSRNNLNDREIMVSSTNSYYNRRKQLRQCVFCKKRISLEYEKSPCQRHAGPINEIFGGVCMACGRPSHTFGCIVGQHLLQETNSSHNK